MRSRGCSSGSIPDKIGNNFRLITRVYYGDQTVTLYNFLTHKEYDRERWKKDCDC
ncbi:MAG: type II toxin-antitoxin system HigB family toxin [Blastocatellia bacterium]